MNMNVSVSLRDASKGSSEPLKILVVGATGGTGKAVVARLLTQGHRVSAFARTATSLDQDSPEFRAINGDVTEQKDVEAAVAGQDVVIVTLGISENPIRVRLFGSRSTADNVRSIGTRNVISAMHKHGVRRLIVQSSFGVGETRGLLGFIDQLFFSLLLKPQIADTEIQEEVVRQSGLEWVLAQPVHLTDDETEVPPFISISGQARLMKVARKSVASFLSLAVHDSNYHGKSVAISG
jgi:uncharacterized protein YbjT (DUF2867 family)